MMKLYGESLTQAGLVVAANLPSGMGGEASRAPGSPHELFAGVQLDGGRQLAPLLEDGAEAAGPPRAAAPGSESRRSAASQRPKRP
jgi:hypothetical protein